MNESWECRQRNSRERERGHWFYNCAKRRRGRDTQPGVGAQTPKQQRGYQNRKIWWSIWPFCGLTLYLGSASCPPRSDDRAWHQKNARSASPESLHSILTDMSNQL